MSFQNRKINIDLSFDENIFKESLELNLFLEIINQKLPYLNFNYQIMLESFYVLYDFEYVLRSN